MDKPNQNSKPSKLSYTEPKTVLLDPEAVKLGIVEVDSESNPPYNYVEPKVVKIMSTFDARLEYTGQVSGKQYVWSKAGSIVPVDAEDSEYLLAKRIGGKLCCGNSLDTNKLFTIAI